MEYVEIVRGRQTVEWPTAVLVVCVYGLWFALTYEWRALPTPVLAVLGAISVAWHMSLQHEVIHNHPTKWRRLNKWIGTWPLSLWLPFEVYRVTHLKHHNDLRLTDPLDDPESYYYTREQWTALGMFGRAISRAQSTLLGRLTLGPAWAMGRFWGIELRAIANGDRRRRIMVARHIVEAAVILVWVIGVCGMPFWTYFWIFVYGGTSLALVRSFAEHRADETIERRTAIVETCWFFGPLFLFNNLHVVHHMHSAMPWYDIPRWYRLNRAAVVERNGGLVYKNYFEVARRYLFKPHDRALHPSESTIGFDQEPAYQSYPRSSQ